MLGKNRFNSSYLDNFFSQIHSNSHRVIHYHFIGEHTPEYYYQPVKTSVNIFKEQLGWLKQIGYTNISLDEAYHAIISGEKLKKTFSITTDDGFKENYEILAPILLEAKMTATIFLLNNCIDNHDLMWRNKLAKVKSKLSEPEISDLIRQISKEYSFYYPGDNQDIMSWSDGWPMSLKEELANRCWSLAKLPPLKNYLNEHKPYLTTKQINELISEGFGIGGHTYSHPDCSKLSEGELEIEINDSIKELAKKFKRKVDFFSYPFGKRPKLNLEQKILKESNIKIALGTKNRLRNYKNFTEWERDKMEQELNKSKFWFLYVPVLRRYFLQPMGIKK